MTRGGKLVVLVVFAVAVGLVLAARPGARAVTGDTAAAAGRPVPRLVDLGAGKCIPCKAMAPILEELRAEYAGRLEVTFVDVWVNPDAGQPYGIRMIPTQIFLGADGRELSRHEGFMSKADILARWKSHGVEL
ncbi:MAG: thioredoxin family protein [Anaeromyxobacter sp.]